jgi:hypothetical protein
LTAWSGPGTADGNRRLLRRVGEVLGLGLSLCALQRIEYWPWLFTQTT